MGEMVRAVREDARCVPSLGGHDKNAFTADCFDGRFILTYWRQRRYSVRVILCAKKTRRRLEYRSSRRRPPASYRRLTFVASRRRLWPTTLSRARKRPNFYARRPVARLSPSSHMSNNFYISLLSTLYHTTLSVKELVRSQGRAARHAALI